MQHIERLRLVKSALDTGAPKRHSHMEHNAKKEMNNLGKVVFDCNLNLERMSEIQYQNRVLLRKMLQIDLKQGGLNP